MAAVFGLLILTVEWVVLRRVTGRLAGRSVGVRVLAGAAAGLAMSAAVAVLGIVVAVVTTQLGMTPDSSPVAAAAASTLLASGLLFLPFAAAFGAILLGVERYRVAPEGHAGE